MILDDEMVLQPNTDYRIGSYAPPSEAPQVIAEITADSSGVRDDEEADRLIVVDLRAVTTDKYGSKHYDGQLLDSSLQYLLIQPNLLNWEEGKGYKGLRRDEDYIHGRPDIGRIPARDARNRFEGAASTTSRNHFNIRVDHNDMLWVSDLDSANGTFVASGEAALARMTYEEQESVENSIPRIALARTALREVGLQHPETEPGMGLPLSNEAITALKELGADRKQNRITQELLADEELEPKVGVRVDGKEFYLSGVTTSKSGIYKYIVGYVKTEGSSVVIPRLFYKSQSDGGWRATPGIESDGRISKGHVDSHGGYVQLTKPAESIMQMLEFVEDHHMTGRTLGSNELIDYFGITRQSNEGVQSFEHEVTPHYLHDVESYYGLYESFSPGTGYLTDPIEARSRIEHMQLPHDFEPDFTAPPIKRFTTNHSLAGKVGVSVYRTDFQGQPTDWHIVEDAGGGVWLDKVVLDDGKVTSYGTAQNVELLGALSAKPFEYATQTKNMVPGVDYDFVPGTRYVDLRNKYWGRMPWVKRYKQAKNAR